ncbi:MAG TPA: carbohydrate kinase [Burkholderiales bacterium]|nr:carbohydrate kinase [Burkholderiales bacterium]
MTSTALHPLPRFVSLGEALTDFLRTGDDTWVSRAGGAGWNVARVVARLGIPSAFAGAVSQDRFGDELARLSAAAGLDMRFLQRAQKPPLLAMVPETAPPAYFFIGADSADLAFAPGALPRGWMKAAQWLHVGGISLAREPLAARLIRVIEEAKAAGCKVSFDPNFRNLMTPAFDRTLEHVARCADAIKVSDEDLRGLFRTSDVPDALRALRAFNPSAPVLLTRGAEGAALYSGGEAFTQAPPAIEVADAVGAGDAAMGGWLYSLMSNPGAGGREHLRFAVAAGAAACLNAGAVPPDRTSIQRLLQRMP